MMAYITNYLYSMNERNPYLLGICLLFSFVTMALVSPDLLASPPELPDIGTGGDDDLLAQSAEVTQGGMYYAIWIIGIVLIVVPAYYLVGAFGDWMKGRKELGEVGVVIIVGVVVVVAGMWLLATALAMTESGLSG